MTERGILFSAPMVRALLNGSKTQTRRIAKPRRNPSLLDGSWTDDYVLDPGNLEWLMDDNPYGQPGDRLWVRETFMDLQGTGVEYRDQAGLRQRYAYAADVAPGSHADGLRKDYGLKWKPCLHMPRPASRILLEITSVRAERLNDCSEADAIAEGVELERCCGRSSDSCGTFLGGCCGQPDPVDPVVAYRELWESINGAGSWNANPWVWVIEFKKVETCAI